MQVAAASQSQLENNFPRVNVLGVGVHAVTLSGAVGLVMDAIENDRKGYVCVTGVHGVMEAQKDEAFRGVLNRAFLVTPDGMPLVWVGRHQGESIGRVFGPELMLEVCKASVDRRVSHFLYGGNPGVAEQLKDNLERWYPGLRIVGTYTPPFRPLDDGEREALVKRIEGLQPDIIWVGLSTPKQERFMAEYLPILNTKLMFGVGAAFDVHTGRVRDCSDWVKRAGLQWGHRLLQEPKRLWKRYLINNPKFVLAITAQMAGIRKYDLGEINL